MIRWVFFKLCHFVLSNFQSMHLSDSRCAATDPLGKPCSWCPIPPHLMPLPPVTFHWVTHVTGWASRRRRWWQWRETAILLPPPLLCIWSACWGGTGWELGTPPTWRPRLACGQAASVRPAEQRDNVLFLVIHELLFAHWPCVKLKCVSYSDQIVFFYMPLDAKCILPSEH